MIVRFRCKTVSESNNRENWRYKAKRAKLQKALAYAATKRYESALVRKYPCEVVITRYGAKLLDDDNLAGAMKAIRDGIAKALGKNDAPGNGIIWKYRQQKKNGLNEVGISIESIPEWQYQNEMKGK